MEEPLPLLLKGLAQQEPVESSDVAMAEVAVHPAVQVEGLEAQEGLAVSLEAVAVLVE